MRGVSNTATKKKRRETKEKYLNRCGVSRSSKEAIMLLERNYYLTQEEATRVYKSWREDYIKKREVL